MIKGFSKSDAQKILAEDAQRATEQANNEQQQQGVDEQSQVPLQSKPLLTDAERDALRAHIKVEEQHETTGKLQQQLKEALRVRYKILRAKGIENENIAKRLANMETTLSQCIKPVVYRNGMTETERTTLERNYERNIAYFNNFRYRDEKRLAELQGNPIDSITHEKLIADAKQGKDGGLTALIMSEQKLQEDQMAQQSSSLVNDVLVVDEQPESKTKEQEDDVQQEKSIEEYRRELADLEVKIAKEEQAKLNAKLQQEQQEKNQLKQRISTLQQRYLQLNQDTEDKAIDSEVVDSEVVDNEVTDAASVNVKANLP